MIFCLNQIYYSINFCEIQGAWAYVGERFEKNFDKSLGNNIYICCADCMEDAKLVKESIMENHPDIVIEKIEIDEMIALMLSDRKEGR